MPHSAPIRQTLNPTKNACFGLFLAILQKMWLPPQFPTLSHTAPTTTKPLGKTGRSGYRTAVNLSDFDYSLPPERIAQEPIDRRDQSRLFALNRRQRNWRHLGFAALPDLLRDGDLLVLNNSKVIPARLQAAKDTGAQIEILLVEEADAGRWWCLLKPGKRVRPGVRLALKSQQGTNAGITAAVVDKNEDGHYLLDFQGSDNLLHSLQAIGQPPLPPYIRKDFNAIAESDKERYQTVFAKEPGSVAAPTAGLHFTPELLTALRAKGIETTEVTLHVGLGTFLPVKTDNVEDHKMHSERFELTAAAANSINQAKSEGKRVVAVGTTSVRVLESVAAGSSAPLQPQIARTDIFIHPPFEFRVVDALITNFHLPKSTLMMLVSAFASPGNTDGRDFILDAYTEAVREEYRFFSYGDAMLIE